MITATDSDQEDFDKHPPQWHEHLEKALLHHTGHGEHPGKYQGAPSLAELRAEIEYPEQMAMEQGQEPENRPPAPPQEAMEQPPRAQPGQRGQKPPSKGTPTAIGRETVAPPPPEGF
jgi:hypothetical protein